MKKLWSNYCKELKIAAQGFYFYMEIIVAVLMLLTVMFLLPEHAPPVKESIFIDIPEPVFQHLLDKEIAVGRTVIGESEKITLKPAVIEYTDKNGKRIKKTYTDKKTITVPVHFSVDTKSGQKTKKKYMLSTFDDMVRLSYAKQYIGSVMWLDSSGTDYYTVFLQGSETQKYKDLISSSHGKTDIDILRKTTEAQQIEYLHSPEILGNRENILPIIVVFANGIMTVLILAAYMAIDKSEGIIKALAVVPMKLSGYFISKIAVVITMSIISSFIIVTPIMGTQPNYLFFTVTLIVLSALSASLGLLIAGFFNDLKESFGAILVLVFILLVPALSYFVPSFYPPWIQLFPSYYMIETIKETLLTNTDIPFVLYTNAGMAALTVFVFLWAVHRLKKTINI